MIRTILRKMALDKGQKFEERCLTVDEYEKELRAQADEAANNRDIEDTERITDTTEQGEGNRQ